MVSMFSCFAPFLVIVLTMSSTISFSTFSLIFPENNALSKVSKNCFFSGLLDELKILFVLGNIEFTSLSILWTWSIAKLTSVLFAAFSASLTKNCSLGLCPSGVNTLNALKKSLSNFESL